MGPCGRVCPSRPGPPPSTRGDRAAGAVPTKGVKPVGGESPPGPSKLSSRSCRPVAAPAGHREAALCSVIPLDTPALKPAPTPGLGWTPALFPGLSASSSFPVPPAFRRPAMCALCQECAQGHVLRHRPLPCALPTACPLPTAQMGARKTGDLRKRKGSPLPNQPAHLWSWPVRTREAEEGC